MRVALIAVLVGGCDLVYSLDRPTAGWEDMAIGFTHACAVTPNHELYCWGSNTYGEVGVGDELSTIDTPTKIAGTWSSVATTYVHTCALQADSSVWCWGLDGAGQLGNGSTTTTRIPKQVDGTFTKIRTGILHTCAIDDDYHLWCWGGNTAGQVGDGTTTNRLEPTQIDGDSRWIDVAGGIYHTCGIRREGTLWCWGDDNSSFPVPIVDPALGTSSLVPVQLGTDTWTQITAQIDATCGITTAGHLRCWGMNNYGQSGLGTMPRADAPMPVLADGVDVDDWIQLDGSVFSACAVRANGDAWCWGNNERGELTVEDLGVPVPQRVSPPKGRKWTRVAMGAANICLLDDMSRMWCAGGDSFSQLGNGGTSPRAPRAPAPDSPADVIVASDHATCAVRTGQIACGGRGSYFQLGVGDAYSRQELTPLAGGPWSTVAVGFEHACAIGDGGAASCWGTDRTEMLGNGAGVQPALVPMPIMGGRSFMSIDAGASFTCGVDSTRAIYCWGDNSSGQLGNNSMAPNSPIPAGVIASQLTMWNLVSAGYTHTCGLTSVGVVRCWGDNSFGQLGDSTMDPKRAATSAVVSGEAGPLPAFAQVSAGADHSCAVGADDSLWCWGSNRRGQLGIETAFLTEIPSAKQVPGAWIAVSAGTYFTCAIKKDETLWCWGANGRGQLGDGSLVDRRMPTPVEGTGWTAVSAGTDHVCARRGTNVSCWGNNDDGATVTGDAWTTELQEIVRPAP